MIFHLGQGGAGQLGITLHHAVVVYEGDPGTRQPSQPIGQFIPLRAIGIAAGCQLARLLGHERQTYRQVTTDTFQQIVLDGGTQIKLTRTQRNHDQSQHRCEQLGANAQSHSSAPGSDANR